MSVEVCGCVCGCFWHFWECVGVQRKEQKEKQTIYYLLLPLDQNPNVVSDW